MMQGGSGLDGRGAGNGQRWAILHIFIQLFVFWPFLLLIIGIDIFSLELVSSFSDIYLGVWKKTDDFKKKTVLILFLDGYVSTFFNTCYTL